MLLASLLAPAAKEERVKVVGPNTTEPSSSDTIAKERCVACHAVVLEIERGMRRGRRSELALHDVFDEVCTQDRLDKFDLPPPRMVDLCLEIVSGWYDDGGVLKTLIAGGKREEAETFWPRLRDDVCISGSEYCRGQQFRPERHGEGLTWEGGLEKKLEDGGTNAVGFTGRKWERTAVHEGSDEHDAMQRAAAETDEVGSAARATLEVPADPMDDPDPPRREGRRRGGGKSKRAKASAKAGPKSEL